jgi:hypothetical protein
MPTDAQTRSDFNRYLTTVSPKGVAYSVRLDRSVARLGKEELEDVPDLLGDASENDFDFLSLSDDGVVVFDKGVTPIAFLGSLKSEEPVTQCEGLLVARIKPRGGVELIAIDVGGTLVPGTEKVVGKGFEALRLRALVKPKAAAKANPTAKPTAKTPAQGKAKPRPQAQAKAQAKTTPAQTPPAVKPAATPAAAGLVSPDLQAFWAELDRYGGWRKELSREMGLKDGQAPTDALLDGLFGQAELCIYLAGGVLDLTPLRRFRGLRELELQGHDAIHNLSILAELHERGLRALSLRQSKVKDLSFLADLPALESLDLSKIPATDLTPLKRLVNLTKLDVGYMGLTTLEPLRALVGLRRLVCFHNRIASLEPVAAMPNLEVLHANSNAFADLAPLAKLVHLTQADVAGTFREGKVTTVAPLGALPALAWLDISDQPVSDLAPLAGCKRLETLKCRVSSEVMLKGLDALVGLKSLKEVVTHPALLSKQDRATFNASRPKVLRLTT